MNIFLIGFMGAGKTYWGKKWAERLNLEFIDIDDVLADEKKKTIAEIFAQDGEDFFRRLETTILRRFDRKNNVIISSGGGTPCFNDNISWMNKKGTTIYLRSSPENILKRLINEKEKRPLIKNLQGDELLTYITNKIEERDFFYKQAKIILDVDDLPENYLPEFLIV